MMKSILVTRPGVIKFLKNLKPHKTTAPDRFSERLLQETSVFMKDVNSPLPIIGTSNHPHDQ